MRSVFPIILCGIVSLASLSCKTTQAQRREQFLVSHGFHHEQGDAYGRHYGSLGVASQDLGFSVSSLSIPPNGSGVGPDVRVVMLKGWGFVVTAEAGSSLDELSTPCTVETALFQFPADKEMPKRPSSNTGLEPAATTP